MAMSLCLGASAVWVGTRFVASKEASAPPRHKEGVLKTGYHDTIRSLIYTGRPLRIMKTPYVMNWEDNKMVEMKEMLAAGV
jgi:NAD(P)H-dependent flavin oxidoreductase YrpB (nitropropane dioxygenase family)